MVLSCKHAKFCFFHHGISAEYIAFRKITKIKSKIIFIYDSANRPSKVKTGFSATAATLFTTVRRLWLIYRGSIEVG